MRIPRSILFYALFLVVGFGCLGLVEMAVEAVSIIRWGRPFPLDFDMPPMTPDGELGFR